LPLGHAARAGPEQTIEPAGRRMKKLTPQELAALYFLDRDGPIVPGDAAKGEAGQMVLAVLNALVRKKRATVEATDDGPRYAIAPAGRAEIAP
jgi:hypothetical protein